jgi:hypothetical protein
MACDRFSLLADRLGELGECRMDEEEDEDEDREEDLIAV